MDKYTVKARVVIEEELTVYAINNREAEVEAYCKMFDKKISDTNWNLEKVELVERWAIREEEIREAILTELRALFTSKTDEDFNNAIDKYIERYDSIRTYSMIHTISLLVKYLCFGEFPEEKDEKSNE